MGDLDLSQKEERYASIYSRDEEEDAQMCPCGKAIESRTTTAAGESEICREELDVLEEMTKIGRI